MTWNKKIPFISKVPSSFHVSYSFLFFPFYYAGELHMTTQSYEAKNEDELSFDIGVHLEVIEKTLDGWWRAM